MKLKPILNNTRRLFDINAMSYLQRAEYAQHPLAKQLFLLMHNKKTNLIHNPDVTAKKEFLELVDAVGPYICALKTHIDIIIDFDWDLIDQLIALAKKHNFLIIEDRKFCDIGSVVQQQYRDGVYKIVEWADIVIAHAISGAGVIEGLKQVGRPWNRAMFLLVQMSSADNLIDGKYTQRAVALAEQQSDFVIGLIAQERCSHDPGLLVVTPGINLQQKTDGLSQQYNDPEYAIGQRGSDLIIVGRAIYEVQDPVSVAQHYRDVGWKSYSNRIIN